MGQPAAGIPSPADASVTVSLGKGAWDCDKNVAIPPEKEVWTASHNA